MTRSTYGRVYAGEMIPICPRSEIIRYKAPVQGNATAACTGLSGWFLCVGDPLFITGIRSTNHRSVGKYAQSPDFLLRSIALTHETPSGPSLSTKANQSMMENSKFLTGNRAGWKKRLRMGAFA